MKALVSALRKLAESPQGQLPQSALTKAQQQALQEFMRHSNCVRKEPAGRGITYRVIDPQTLNSHLRHLSPGYEQDLPQDMPQRAGNISMSRSSKGAHHRHKYSHLLLRATTGIGVSWARDDLSLDLSHMTRDYGAAALTIQMDDHWHSEQPLWLVENQALFDNLDWLASDEPASVVWYRGQISNLLLDWLSHKKRTPHVILFPDYDGVGLKNYVRLHTIMGDNCSFWLMPEWEEKLKTYGNNQLWQDTFSDFQHAVSRLNAQPGSPLAALIEAMQQYALGLEQETVWL